MNIIIRHIAGLALNAWRQRGLVTLGDADLRCSVQAKDWNDGHTTPGGEPFGFDKPGLSIGTS